MILEFGLLPGRKRHCFYLYDETPDGRRVNITPVAYVKDKKYVKKIEEALQL